MRERTAEERRTRAAAIRTIKPRPIPRSGHRGWLAVTRAADEHVLGLGVEGATEEEAIEKFYTAREDWARMVDTPADMDEQVGGQSDESRQASP